MFITIINDCHDENVRGRQITRASSLFDNAVSLVGVKNDIEAAGNLIDTIDAAEDREGVILVNVAPRSKNAWWLSKSTEYFKGKKEENGTPFCYFKYKNILIVSSVEGLTLSLVKKLGLVESVNVMNIPTVLQVMQEKGIVSEELKNHISNSQFRSFDFVPRVAKWLTDGYEIPSEKLDISNIADVPKAVWFVDNFGNCKTTILKEEMEDQIKDGIIVTKVGDLNFVARLADVPEKTKAMTKGSSGLGNKRFLEIVIQGENASKNFNIQSGDVVIG